ncbi:branched-chain amino acid ABC transporter permease [Halorarum salinum]|uniref:Branched-chain amino acid ABC transporter permease n=1 Tax=Halorarum salinum TaxID=2743089 RepID=A0A7D5LEC2_9EURY|nr:branched-chain amino acid ABC transporter permease [Halobaculum salinum]
MELPPRRAALGLLGLLLLVAVPDLAKLSPGLQLRVVHEGVLFGLAAVGLNLLLRHTRLVSFGHAAFFGTGAYTAAVLASHFDVTSMLVLLAAATLFGTLMAGVVGYLSLRHTGLYFSLLTLAFGQLLYAVVIGRGYFGSSDGLAVRPGEANQALLFGVEFGSEVYSVVVYYLTVLVVLLSLLVMWRVANSPFGDALDAIGQNRTRARFIGIPVRRYVLAAFVVSGIYGGVAGGMYGLVQQHVRPEPTLYFLRSGDILFMAILGGFRTLVGPLVGGIVLVFLQDVGRDVTNYFDALTGIVLVALVYGFPRGIVGSLKAGSPFRRRLASLRADPSVAGAWLRGAWNAVVDAAARAGENLRIIIFGVN